MEILVATWGEGLYRVRDGALERELTENVTGLCGDIAVVDGVSLRQRRAGTWTAIATSSVELSACTKLGEAIFVGTNDARVFRVEAGELVACASFDGVEGRERWYAGTAIVDGKVVGPPLGVRSMRGTCDGATLLVNIHVGGIPRSTDGGKTWQATIDLEWDAHEVTAHATKANLVAAATGFGLATSSDAGVTWTLIDRGLHAKHCSAAAFVGDALWVSASTDPFSKDGALYRLDGTELRRIDLPVAGKVDTGGIATRGDVVAVADTGGQLHVSRDRGQSWQRVTDKLPYPTGLAILD